MDAPKNLSPLNFSVISNLFFSVIYSVKGLSCKISKGSIDIRWNLKNKAYLCFSVTHSHTHKKDEIIFCLQRRRTSTCSVKLQWGFLLRHHSSFKQQQRPCFPELWSWWNLQGDCERLTGLTRRGHLSSVFPSRIHPTHTHTQPPNPPLISKNITRQSSDVGPKTTLWTCSKTSEHW